MGPPLGIRGSLAHHTGGCLRKGVTGNTLGLQPGGPTLAIISHPARQHGLVAPSCGTPRCGTLANGVSDGRISDPDGHVKHDQCVHLVGRQDCLDGQAVLLGRRGCDEINGILQAGSRRQEGREPGLCPVGQFQHAEVARLACVCAEYGRTARIRHDGNASPQRQRLIRQRLREGEHLVQRLGANHAGLAEQRIHGDIAGGQCRRVGSRRPPPSLCPAGLDGDNGFVTADPARDAGKATWVAEGFEIQEDNVGVRVAFPVLQEIVPGHVRFIADADKGRETHMEASGGGHDR